MKTLILLLLIITKPLFAEEAFINILKNTNPIVKIESKFSLNTSYSSIKIESDILSFKITEVGERIQRKIQEIKISKISIPLNDVDIETTKIGNFSRIGKNSINIKTKDINLETIKVSYHSVNIKDGQVTNRTNELSSSQIYLELGDKEIAEQFFTSFKEYMTKRTND